MHLLKLKREDMLAAVAAAGTFQKWMDNGGAEDMEKEERECAEKDEDMDAKMHVYRAFKDKPNQWDFIQAADYSDTWFQEKECQFNVYYICQRKWGAEGKDRCNAAIQSLMWDRLVDDPIATKQRWYYNIRGTRYNTAYGVLV